MIKLSALATAMTFGILLSQDAMANVFCETEVPRSSQSDTTPNGPNSNGRKDFQNITMCFDDDENAIAQVKKIGHVLNGAGNPATQEFQLTVNLLEGHQADLYIIDAQVGNIIMGCNARDTNPSAASSVTNAAGCFVTQSGQAYIYLHVG